MLPCEHCLPCGQHTCLSASAVSQVCFAAVGIVSDLCRSVGQAALVESSAEIMQALFNALADANLQKSLKPQVLFCFLHIILTVLTYFTY